MNRNVFSSLDRLPTVGVFLWGGEYVAGGKYQEWLTDDGLLRIEGWARDGLTDEQIAKNIGVGAKTLYRWKDQHSPICQALKRGKEVVDREVENALLKRALGYTYDEVTQEADELGDLSVTKVVTKQVSPDVTAQIFWLRNRKGTEWSNKDAIDAENVKANTKLTKAKTSAIEGLTPNTDMLQSLLDLEAKRNGKD